MKNLVRTGSLILGIAITVFACDPSKGSANKTPEDSGKVVKTDSANKKTDTTKKPVVDTAKNSTAKKQ